MPLKQDELQQNTNRTVSWREWEGVNMTAVRTAIADKEWAWMENAIPIGGGNIQLVPGITPLVTSGDALPAVISRMYGFVLAGNPVQIIIGGDGSLTQVNVSTGVAVSMAAAATVTVNARMTIWRDTQILIIDANGFFSWDGTNFLTYSFTTTGDTHTSTTIDNIPSTAGWTEGLPISGTGIPANTVISTVVSGTSILISNAATGTAAGVTLTVGPTGISGSAIAVFEGRSWIKTARRTIAYSAPNTFSDFSVSHGGGSTVLTDPVFVGSITNMIAALQQLWIIGEGAVNAISNVNTTGTPLTTSFNNTNIVSSVGSEFPSSVSSFFRTIVFLTQYGVYAIVGATPQKLSDKLDGLFPDLDFSADCPFAIGTIHNVYIWSVLVPYVPTATGVGENRNLLLCFAQGKWFFASYTEGEAGPGEGGAIDELTWVSTVVINGAPTIWGTDGATLFQLFADDEQDVGYVLKSKLFDFGDSTQQKQMSHFGLEFSSDSVVNPTIIVENETTQQDQDINLAFNSIQFVGSGPITFTGLGSSPIIWVNPGLQLVRTTTNMRGRYLGYTLEGSEPSWTLSAAMMDVRAGGKWNN